MRLAHRATHALTRAALHSAGMLTGRMHDDVDLQQIVDAYLKNFPAGLDYNAFSQMFTMSDLAKLTLNV